jgi:hypothetical protein
VRRAERAAIHYCFADHDVEDFQFGIVCARRALVDDDFGFEVDDGQLA